MVTQEHALDSWTGRGREGEGSGGQCGGVHVGDPPSIGGVRSRRLLGGDVWRLRGGSARRSGGAEGEVRCVDAAPGRRRPRAFARRSRKWPRQRTRQNVAEPRRGEGQGRPEGGSMVAFWALGREVPRRGRPTGGQEEVLP